MNSVIAINANSLAQRRGCSNSTIDTRSTRLVSATAAWCSVNWSFAATTWSNFATAAWCWFAARLGSVQTAEQALELVTAARCRSFATTAWFDFATAARCWHFATAARCYFATTAWCSFATRSGFVMTAEQTAQKVLVTATARWCRNFATAAWCDFATTAWSWHITTASWSSVTASVSVAEQTCFCIVGSEYKRHNGNSGQDKSTHW